MRTLLVFLFIFCGIVNCLIFEFTSSMLVGHIFFFCSYSSRHLHYINITQLMVFPTHLCSESTVMCKTASQHQILCLRYCSSLNDMTRMRETASQSSNKFTANLNVFTIQPRSLSCICCVVAAFYEHVGILLEEFNFELSKVLLAVKFLLTIASNLTFLHFYPHAQVC